MKLHANAPLGPKGRGIMVHRVIEEQWSLAEAAAAVLIGDPQRRRCVRGGRQPVHQRREGEDDEEVGDGRRGREDGEVGAARRADRSHEPDAGGGRQAANGVAAHEDQPG